MEHTREYGKMTTPPSTAPQQHPAWQGLGQEDDNISQLKYGWYNESLSVQSLQKHSCCVDIGNDASVHTMSLSFQCEIPPILSDKNLLSSRVVKKNCFVVEKGMAMDAETKSGAG